MFLQIKLFGAVVLAAGMVSCASAAVASPDGAASTSRASVATAQQRSATTSPAFAPSASPKPLAIVIPAPRTPAPATSAPPTLAPTAATVAPRTGFDASFYIGKGDAFNCPNFASQADAQAVLRADPTDPNRLDTDRDGIACESNRAPKDLVAVPRR